ncbi:tetratricopeptide repeat protein [candidate division CSSED10-310 bacterium]|uniref:Tetratricopeptide repeat protein n=1 Tax=candidate division CSSED10-310 bacterium TaxID=2855610 RepID=A0ABV6Z0J7_UNCC1
MNKNGEQIGEYIIVRLLGQGGMGVVYEAEQRLTGKRVALKTVTLPRKELLGSLRREIFTLATIRHPGVVRIVDQGIAGDLPWYAMELIEGIPLNVLREQVWRGPGDKDSKSSEVVSQHQDDREHQKETASWWTETLVDQMPEVSPLTFTASDYSPEAIIKSEPFKHRKNGPRAPGDSIFFNRFIHIIYSLCRTLSYLHGQGLVHGDLKPGNILIKKNDFPIIVDFGLVSQFAGHGSRENLSLQQSGKGTLLYNAPEQILGESLDARTDLYAIGCIFYEFLTGRTPFRGSTVADVVNAHLYSQRIAPITYDHTIPPAINSLVLQLIQREPQHRLGYAADIARILTSFLETESAIDDFPPARTYLYRSRLAGREHSSQIIDDCFSQTWAGNGNMVLIAGEGGIGKTRFAMELANAVTGQSGEVLTGSCFIRSSRLLDPFRPILQNIVDYCHSSGRKVSDRIFGKRGKVLMNIEPSIAHLSGQAAYDKAEDLTPEAARLRIIAYLQECLKNYIDMSYCVIIIDDLHWADDLTLSFLTSCVQSGFLGEIPLCILCTYRPEEFSPEKLKRFQDDRVVHIQLERLEKQDVIQVIGEMLAMAQPPVLFGEFIAESSEGKPFFIAEYLQLLVDEQLLVRNQAGDWELVSTGDKPLSRERYRDLPIPRSLKSLIARRLIGLPEVSQKVLNITVTIGQECQSEFLHSFFEEDTDYYEGLHFLIQRHVLEETAPGTIRFVHTRIKDFLYDTISEERSIKLHQLCARRIQDFYASELDNYAAELAYHYDRAGMGAEALHWYSQSAEIATRQYAHERALHAIERALTLVESHDEEKQYHLIRKRCNIYRLLGNRRAQRDDVLLLGALAEKIDTAEIHISLSQNEIQFYSETGEFEQALQALERWQERCDKDTPVEDNTFLQIYLGDVYVKMGEFQKAKKHIDTAIEKVEHLQDPKKIMQANLTLGLILFGMGHYEQAAAVFTKTLPITIQVQDRQNQGLNLNNLGLTAAGMGKYEEAQDYFKQALHILTDIGDILGTGRVTNNLGLYAVGEGKIIEAEGYFARSYEIALQVDNKTSAALSLSNRAYCLKYMGHYEQAQQLLHEALLLARKTGDKQTQALAHINLSNLLLYRGQFEEAERYSVEGHEIAKTSGLLIHQIQLDTFLSRFEYESGNFIGARERQHAIREYCPKSNITMVQMECARRATQMGDWVEAASIFDELHSEMCETDNKVSQANIRSWLGYFQTWSGQLEQGLFNCLQAYGLVDRRENAFYAGDWALNLGYALFYSGRYAEAENIFTEAYGDWQKLDNVVLAGECGAGIARAMMKQGKDEDAWKTIAPLLPTGELTIPYGVRDPFFTFLTCYELLSLKDKRRAENMLCQIHKLLQLRAEQFTSAEEKQLYLQNIPSHRTVIALYNRSKKVEK